MRKFLVALFYLGIYGVLTFYIGYNVWVWLQSMFHFGTTGTLIYSLLLTVASLSFLFDQFLKNNLFFRILGSYWFGFFQYSLMFFPVVNIVVFILYNFSLPKDIIIFWSGVVMLIIMGFLYIYGFFNAYAPITRTYHITIPKRAGDRQYLRIAMASDMHFGSLSGKKHCQRLVEKINEITPDIILLPGDIVDDHPRGYIKKKMREDMLNLQAPLGVYGVLGNHEYYGKAIPEFLEEMNKSGIIMLLDKAVMVEDSFYLVGRKDKTDSNRQSYEQLLNELDSSLPIIVMDHQPYHFQQAAENGVDLLLSGHTHRGQIAPNHIVTKRMYELDWGYKQKETMHVIVSSGYGFWGPPLRLGSRSEIVQIDVTFKEED